MHPSGLLFRGSLLWFLVCVVHINPINAQGDLSTSWQLDEVVCHEVGALLKYTSEVQANPGEHVMLLQGLPPDVDVSDAQISLPEGFRLVAVDVVMTSLTSDEMLASLKNRLQGQRLALALEEALLGSLEQERAFLEANRAIGGESEVLLVDDVEEMRHYLAQKHRELALERVDLVSNVQELTADIHLLEDQIAEAEWASSQQSPALKLKVQGGGRGVVEVRVATSLAGWFSSYDLSWDEGDLSIERYARVVQTTGRPWNRVKLTFRTGQPMGSFVPQAQPVMAVTKAVDAQAQDVDYCANYKWVNSGLRDDRAKAEVLQGQGAFASNWNMSTQERVTVEGQGTPTRVFLDNRRLDATERWQLDANASDAAQRSCETRGWMEASMLSGEGRVFHGNTLVGVLPLNVPVWGDSLVVQLGLDRDIHLLRHFGKEASGSKRWGGKQVVKQSRTLQVRNDKSEDVVVDVVEWLPQGRDLNVEVVVADGGTWDPELGSVRWSRVNVKAGETWETSLDIQITMPKGMVLRNF
jgi:hypothetical protein